MLFLKLSFCLCLFVSPVRFLSGRVMRNCEGLDKFDELYRKKAQLAEGESLVLKSIEVFGVSQRVSLERITFRTWR